ncbi:transcription termination/antitermination protein NusG [Methylosinus sp. LW4]|uniref:transcription termination/antitermination protein NusG n=1 Tax=Methylosinus sp. LW4 TaxID=136993 RepID=UPI0003733681|nr:transcription termination/antitermination protein NusG [Methylosinus sp. LW4]
MGAQAGETAKERRWYVLEAREGKDFDVCLRLAAAGFQVWRPIDKSRVSIRRSVGGVDRITRREVKVARFGRYLFVRMECDWSCIFAISTMPGVTGFICYAGGNEPAPVPDALVEFYRNHAPEHGKPRPKINIGAVVRICAGPFALFTGEVESVDKGGRLVIGVEIFGRLTPVLMESGNVELLEPGAAAPPKKTADKDRTIRRSSAHAH